LGRIGLFGVYSGDLPQIPGRGHPNHFGRIALRAFVSAPIPAMTGSICTRCFNACLNQGA